ncbi:MAG: RidA family protein [Flavobacteriales bacterium]|nr:RidA family protein [Flavobacteriales bacterium]
MKQIIETPNAPEPIGPYSQGVVAGNTLYISGQIAIDPATNLYLPADAATETRQVMHNLEAILKQANLTFEQVVKTTIFLLDMNDFPIVNEVYGSFFWSQFPARETVQVSVLPKNARLEISMIAVKG